MGAVGNVQFVGGPYDGVTLTLSDTTAQHVVIERSVEYWGGPVTTTRHTYHPIAGGFYYEHACAEVVSVEPGGGE